MSIFEQLENNKGTISSALGKRIAKEILEGNKDILDEAIDLVIYRENDKSAKNIRAGAAKIVEIVAEKKPEWVAPFLDRLFPALDLPEPQTRWMIIRTMGFCADQNQDISINAFEYARNYIKQKEGLCLSSSAELYLGDIGSLSKENAKEVFPILEEALANAEVNEVDWILEAFMKISPNLDNKTREKISKLVKKYTNAPKKSTQKRVNKLLKLLN